MPAMAAHIRFLWWQGCPSWERALASLREEMAAQGLDPEMVEVVEVGDEQQATISGSSPWAAISSRRLSSARSQEGQPCHQRNRM